MSLAGQLSQAEGALAAQTAAQQGEASVRQETKASLQAALAERMAARAGEKGDLRLLRQTMSVWVGSVRERASQQRVTLEAGFAELERSVVAYRTESVGRADAAEERFAKMQARLKETDALLGASREVEAAGQAELESVKGKASELGASMQARVVAAESEVASCRAELQAAMREQEERSSVRVEGLLAELEELRGQAAAQRISEEHVKAELQGLKGVEVALQEAVGRENELRAKQAMLDSNQEERSRRTEAVRRAEKLEQQRSLATQMSLEGAVAERDEQLEKVSKEFESYMTARYLLTIRRMASCKASAAFNGWAGAVQRAKRARGTMGRAVTRLMQRCMASAFAQWATLLSYERKHRRTTVKVVAGILKMQEQRLMLRVVAQWSRQAKTIRYERGEEARLSALATKAAADGEVFSLRAEVASLKRSKEDVTQGLENLQRSTSRQVVSLKDKAPPVSAAGGSRSTDKRVAELETRLKLADEQIHQLVTHGGSNPTQVHEQSSPNVISRDVTDRFGCVPRFTPAEAKLRREKLLQR